MPTRPSVPRDSSRVATTPSTSASTTSSRASAATSARTASGACGAPRLIHRRDQPVARSVRHQHAHGTPGAEAHGARGVGSVQQQPHQVSLRLRDRVPRAVEEQQHQGHRMCQHQSFGHGQRVGPAEGQPTESGDGTLALYGLDLGPAGRAGLAHRSPTAATEQRLQPLRQRPRGAGPGLLPPGAIAQVDAGGELAGERADHRVDASSDRGPAQGSLLVHRLGQPQSAKLSETVGDGLGDSHERSGQGHLHQREVHGLARATDAGGHPGVPETGAESQSGRAGLDQPVDVRRLACGRARQPQARRQHQLAAVQERRRVVELDGVRPGEVRVAVADVAPDAGRGSGAEAASSAARSRRLHRRCTKWQFFEETLDGMVMPCSANRA